MNGQTMVWRPTIRTENVLKMSRFPAEEGDYLSECLKPLPNESQSTNMFQSELLMNILGITDDQLASYVPDNEDYLSQIKDLEGDEDWSDEDSLNSSVSSASQPRRKKKRSERWKRRSSIITRKDTIHTESKEVQVGSKKTTPISTDAEQSHIDVHPHEPRTHGSDISDLIRSYEVFNSLVVLRSKKSHQMTSSQQDEEEAIDTSNMDRTQRKHRKSKRVQKSKFVSRSSDIDEKPLGRNMRASPRISARILK